MPTDIVFSFTGLSERGGRTGPHRDGFGIAFYEGRGLRLFRDQAPSAESEIARLVRSTPIRSTAVIGHIRAANSGPVCLANTHPFTRELWGRHWVFAHNGQLHGFHPPPGFYWPIGDTDSERAFCALLDVLRASFSAPPPLGELTETLVSCCRQYARHGVFNILLSNGDWLFSYCSTKLACITRCAPFGTARLKDADLSVDFSAVTRPSDVVTVIATEPLSGDETWLLYAPGQWRLWIEGECAAEGREQSCDLAPLDQKMSLENGL